jgi:hypothetical protein
MRTRSLTIPDARGQDATLRVTWHPEHRKIVLSHWRDGLCVASTPIELAEVSALIGVLADSLGDAVLTTESAMKTTSSSTAGFWARLRVWLRPRLAQIVELRNPKHPEARQQAG